MKTLVLSVSALFLTAAAGAVCEGFGPQTPRDIDARAGENPVVFATAPAFDRMNLCNVHFHARAEHRAAAFSLAAEGEPGFQCNERSALTEAELAPVTGDVCGGVVPGDTIEVHWVHTSCDVEPGPGLGSCLSASCGNPQLRVETQVFLVVNDPAALDFRGLAATTTRDGFHQAATLPTDTGTPVEFLGSTTGPSYDAETCSPLQVTWSVRPQCARVHVESLGAWCGENVFGEDHAHGVRALVTEPLLLSRIGE